MSTLTKRSSGETPRQKLRVSHHGIAEEDRSAFFNERSHLKDAITLSPVPAAAKQTAHATEDEDLFHDVV